MIILIAGATAAALLLGLGVELGVYVGHGTAATTDHAELVGLDSGACCAAPVAVLLKDAVFGLRD